MNHIVLLGDSIFDNGRYVDKERGEQPVIDQLRALLPSNWTATLAAVDGHVAGNVCGQLQRVPRDASHLVVSVGGNDALSQSHLLLAPAESTIDALTKVARAREQFRCDYRAMINSVRALAKPTVVCTIYDGISLDAWGVSAGRDIMLAALATFNDVIIDEAVRARLPILDLRRICDEGADYSDVSPIEPSAAGGAKIARAIWHIVADNDFARGQTVVYGSEVLGYDEQAALTGYIWRSYRHLMTDDECLAEEAFSVEAKIRGSGSFDGELPPVLLRGRRRYENNSYVQEALRCGYERFQDGVRDRILKEHPASFLINRCPSCQRVVATAKAQQCLSCGEDWHSREK